MSRVKGGVISLKTRRNVLRRVKGYKFGRSTKEAQAYEAIAHAGSHSFAHRRDKKSDFRRLWNVRISSATKAAGLSYSKFIGGLKKKNIAIDRKILADLAENNPEVFKDILKQVA